MLNFCHGLGLKYNLNKVDCVLTDVMKDKKWMDHIYAAVKIQST